MRDPGFGRSIKQSAQIVLTKESCSIRRATVEDADTLAELGKRTYLQYFSSIWGPERLRSYLVEQYAADKLASELADTQYNGFLIASIGKQPAGFLKINWQQHEPMTRRPGAELQKLYVDARFGNRGIGTRLLKSSLILA